ncbi:MAG: hypothetical protein JWP83_3962 [Mycobacterium sp.]|jgi:hypothetical protein|nr:hypothetical protein [Mycobacterium sp.]
MAKRVSMGGLYEAARVSSKNLPRCGPHARHNQPKRLVAATEPVLTTPQAVRTTFSREGKTVAAAGGVRVLRFLSVKP